MSHLVSLMPAWLIFILMFLGLVTLVYTLVARKDSSKKGIYILLCIYLFLEILFLFASTLDFPKVIIWILMFLMLVSILILFIFSIVKYQKNGNKPVTIILCIVTAYIFIFSLVSIFFA